MHVREVSSQICLWIPYRLLRDETFSLKCLFAYKRLPLNEKYHKSGLHRLILDDTLRSPHMLNRDDTFRLKWIFALKTLNIKAESVALNSLCGLHRLIWDNSLRSCIKPGFPGERLINTPLKIVYFFPLFSPLLLLYLCCQLVSCYKHLIKCIFTVFYHV